MATQITELFYQAVHAVDSSIYSVPQKNAWAPKPINYKQWRERLAIKKPFVIFDNQLVIGFIELEEDGHIDCLYVHPQYQGLGVATQLVTYVIAQAKNRGLTALYVEASIVAKSLFEQCYFTVTKQNTIIRNDISLINFSMYRVLT
ncbi:GNAT family N-acetyltransferase [Psychromonas aquatilis]|uniref:GNAT family N-acetyltransferase n=1 Tax=Psychromonas aquatilis TaxID=2005072 RepID=A0ABU9GQJ8_9GAMM